MTTQILTIPNNITPVDALLYRALRTEVPGLVEATLADPANRWLGAFGPFPPHGTKVSLTTTAPVSRAPTRAVIRLYD